MPKRHRRKVEPTYDETVFAFQALVQEGLDNGQLVPEDGKVYLAAFSCGTRVVTRCHHDLPYIVADHLFVHHHPQCKCRLQLGNLSGAPILYNSIPAYVRLRKEDGVGQSN